MRKIFFFTFFYLIAFSPFSFAETNGIDVYMEADNAFLESEFKLKLAVSSSSPVNAFNIVLEYPQEYFEFVRASTSKSFVSIWQSLPLEIGLNRLQFTGGTIEPFLGEGEIVTLFFKPKKLGDTLFVLSEADFALADGRGTEISAPKTYQPVSVINGTKQTEYDFAPSIPKISKIVIAQDPLEKASVLVVKTEDDGEIEEVYVRSRKWVLWSDWQKTQLLATVPRDSWVVQASVISWDGGESSTTVYRWKVVLLKILIIAFFASALWYGFRFIKLWRHKK